MAAVSTMGPSWSKKRTCRASGANQGRGLALVQGVADDQAATASVANSVTIGVQDEATVNIGDAVSVVELGDATAIAGAAVAAGVFVKCTAAGQFIPITTAADQIVGRAKSSAAVAGDEFLLLVLPSVN